MKKFEKITINSINEMNLEKLCETYAFITKRVVYWGSKSRSKYNYAKLKYWCTLQHFTFIKLKNIIEELNGYPF